MFKKIFSIIIFLGFFNNTYLYAQNAKAQVGLLAFNSPKGVVLLFGSNSIGSNGKDIKGNQYTLTRSQDNGNSKQLQLPGMVRNFAAFKKITGENIITQLQHQLKMKTEDALWQYLQTHPDLKDYGFMVFNVPFRVAMGTAFIDEEVKDKKGNTFIYSIQTSADNNNKSNYTSSIIIGKSPDFAAPQLVQSKSSDSIVTIHWKMKMNNQIPYFAFVYKQTGGRGDFQKLASRILVTRKNDSAYFLYNEKVNANSAYKYFIKPADLLGNEGALNSDTVNLVAINFNKFPFITSLKAKDTLNGILLSWKQLAANPMATGIEIQRSRDSRGDYVIIDTINASASSYSDLKLLPHTAYYYRLCLLHAGVQTDKEKFYTAVSADKQKTNHTPDAPYGCSVKTNDKGVRIAWRPVNDPDLYAYYVYRGSSMSSKMNVISPSLTDTVFTDTTSNLSRQLNYVYAVKAVSNAGKESDFSVKIAAHLPFGKEKPRTPGGIKILQDANHLNIQWDDVKKNDPTVLGYILYKHKIESKPLKYDIAKPASEEATRLKLPLAVAGVITVPYYEDTIATNGDKYEYLVSVIDQFGAESGLSATAAAPALQKSFIKPPAQLYVRSVKEGIAVQWEQADMKSVTSFAIYRRSIIEKTSKKIAVVKSSVNSYTDKLVATGSVYVYTIAAVTASGESAASIEKTVRR